MRNTHHIYINTTSASRAVLLVNEFLDNEGSWHPAESYSLAKVFKEDGTACNIEEVMNCHTIPHNSYVLNDIDDKNDYENIMTHFQHRANFYQGNLDSMIESFTKKKAKLPEEYTNDVWKLVGSLEEFLRMYRKSHFFSKEGHVKNFNRLNWMEEGMTHIDDDSLTGEDLSYGFIVAVSFRN